ncbi:hypothetical protein EZS27_025733 [termite gut metagenome]|uniref:Uncharacterized protein n=1 Tax=termite gut metagenome TaxID=433724 RepID=A0A5J4QT21_9ZZZZ
MNKQNSKCYQKDGLWKELWLGYHTPEETQEIMKSKPKQAKLWYN